jgi:hypothetical protein
MTVSASTMIKTTPTHGSAGRGWFRRSAVTAALMAAALTFSGTAASAAAIVLVDRDTIQVSGGTVDFGKGTHSSTAKAEGNPSLPGDVAFSMSKTSVLARVTGYVYYDDPFRSGCASVRVTLYDVEDNRVANFYSTKVCRSGAGAAVRMPLDVTLSGAHGYRLRVVTRVSYDNGVSWPEGAYSDARLGDL